jgi:hypothetical protein
LLLWKVLRAARFRLILPFEPRSQVVHFDEAVLVSLPTARDRPVWPVELLRASPRCERNSLRAIERPEVPERLAWLAAGPIAMAGRMRATRNRRINGDNRRDKDSL